MGKLGWGDDCCRRALALFLLFYVSLQVIEPSASPTKRICLKRELVGASKAYRIQHDVPFLPPRSPVCARARYPIPRAVSPVTPGGLP